MRFLLAACLVIFGIGCSSNPGPTEDNLRRTFVAAREAYVTGDGDKFYEFLPAEARATCPKDVWDREYAKDHAAFLDDTPPAELQEIMSTEIELRDIHIDDGAASFSIVTVILGREVTFPGAAVWEDGKWRGYPPDGDFGEPPCG